MTFFDCEWARIGTKAELFVDIEKASKIAHRHLLDFKSASVATRMSWQSRRETTRVEDLAYSMFGIFDIALDLRYGEREKAFYRLQREIIQNSADESILAWASSESVERREGHGLLAPRPRCFEASANIVPDPFHLRPTYAISNKGLELSVAHYNVRAWVLLLGLFTACMGTIFVFLEESSDGDLNRKLRCWTVDTTTKRSSPVIRLSKGANGLWYRMHCGKLEYTNFVDYGDRKRVIQAVL